MDLSVIRDEIKLELTGGIVELELSDSDIDKIIFYSMRELNRYYDSTVLITVPFSSCIDLSEYAINSILRIYRANAISTDVQGNRVMDPLLASQWQLLSGYGNMHQLQDYSYNYQSWNTLLQIRNTTSTDLAYRFDKASKKLYINISSNTPATITIEYVPILNNPEEITSEYWTDILLRLAIARTKLILGRVRTRFTQSNALWVQDGETLINEGTNELNNLRETLQANSNICIPID